MTDSLLKAGFQHLINTDMRALIDRLVIVSHNNEKFVDFLFEGDIKINENITEQLTSYIINKNLTKKEDFISISNISMEWDNYFGIVYRVTYKCFRYYNKENPYEVSCRILEGACTERKETEWTETINKKDLK